MEGISGTVVARFSLFRGRVQSITILSGPEVFHPAVNAALRRYECQYSEEVFWMTQMFDFRMAPDEPLESRSSENKP